MAWTSEQAAAYAAANPDVWKSYQNDSQNKGLTLQQAMEGHYNNFGQNEGRAAPTANPEYTTQNLSPYISAGIQNSTNVYDLNGRPVTLGAGQRVTGGSLNGNVIYNADGTSAGNYYTSPEDAAYWKQRTQQAMGGSAVIGGGMTLEQQRQNLQNTLNTGGISGATGVTKPAPTGQPSGQSNILQRLAQALIARRGASASLPTGRMADLGNGIKQWQGNTGTPGQSSLSWDPSVLGKPATMGSSLPPSGNSYYSQLAQMLTQRYGGNGITSAGQNGLLKNNSLYSNYLK